MRKIAVAALVAVLLGLTGCATLFTKGGFDYRAGQYAMLWNTQQLGRCYSLASVPGVDQTLELHVGRVAGGRMSNWLFEELKAGDELQLQTASGNCFYVAEDLEQ